MIIQQKTAKKKRNVEKKETKRNTLKIQHRKIVMTEQRSGKINKRIFVKTNLAD